MQRTAAGKSGGAQKELSVVVPAYDETENMRPLCERIFKATRAAGIKAEVLIMDDESKGSDESKAIVETLAGEGYEIRIHCRKKAEGRGLSSAVLLGFDMAKYSTLMCMDADLQHEPESVPDVAAPLLEGRSEFAVGSRHVTGGGLGFEWSIVRRLISSGATFLAVFLTPCTDPMSGFFCTSKEVLSRGRDRCNPVGFKIGLELMVRCRCASVEDVPITFCERVAGESKLSAKQNVLYVQQLIALYWDRFGLLFVGVVILLAAVGLWLLWTLGGMASNMLR